MQAGQRSDLGGTDWQLVEVGEEGRSFPATVPGTVHTDLLAAGRIPDPFLGVNETQVQWVAERDWAWSRSFHVPDELLVRGRVELVFEGIDTVATVLLNGEEIARSDNMYIPLRVDVKGVLCAGENRLEVRIDSPQRVRRERAAEEGLNLPEAFDQAAAYLRKAPYSFGWDWGPALPTSGIWKPVCIHAYDARIADVWPRISLAEDFCSAELTVEMQIDASVEFEGEIEALFSGHGHEIPVRKRVKAPAGTSLQKLLIRVEKPELWWPNGLGGQPLYDLRVRLRSGSVEIDSGSRRVGFRHVELVREPDERGESFFFRVNGHPVFAKGANWIPDDVFLPRVTREDLSRTLSMAREAHMNTLRVWGGGVYESEDFYDLCDEMGLLVWQDFIFACGLYPDHLDWFRESVRGEAEANVKRIRGHACLALLCGNNENHQGWYEWGWKKSGKYDRFYGERLYHEVLPDVCLRLAPEVAYWPGSPFGGETPNSQEQGDMHYWGVWHSQEPAEGYEQLTCRFLSEFGFEAGPPMKTVREFAGDGELRPDSPVMLAHEKCTKGPEKLGRYLETEFGAPTGDVAQWVWRSQYVQAHCVGTALRHTRRRFPDCGGVLFWQLNDCWPVTSWSCMDHKCRPKALWFQARRDFAPAACSLADAGGELSAWLCCDRAEQLPGGEVHVRLMDFAGEVLFEETSSFKGASASGSTRVWSASRETLPVGDGQGVALVADYSVDGKLVSRGVRTFVNHKDQPLGEPSITVDITPVAPGGYDVTLVSDRLVLGAMLTAGGDPAPFNDNFLYLLPGEPVTVRSSVGEGIEIAHAGS